MGFICSTVAYHGNTTAVFEVATGFRNGETGGKHIRSVPVPDVYRLQEGETLENVAESYAQKVQEAIDGFKADGIPFAGLIFCSTFATEGILTPPKNYLKKVVDIVHQASGLYISDEVQGGFGRLGTMWGFENYDIVPDIITTGKPMGNGHPIASVIVKPELGNAFREVGRYFNTFGGNPVSCAAGMAVLDVMEKENLIQNAETTGNYIQKGLQGLRNQYDVAGDIRGQGLFFGLELVKNKETKEPATELTHTIVNAMVKEGILIRNTGPHKNVLKMRPPMVFSKKNADQLLNTLDKVLSRHKL